MGAAAGAQENLGLQEHIGSQEHINAVPGSINYVEGQVTADGQPLNAKSVGNTTVEPGSLLETRDGRVEMLLTPGVFVRLGKNSTLRMVSPSLDHTDIALEHGRAIIEVDEIHRQNTLLVNQGSHQTQMLKRGLYAFDAHSGRVRVYDGKAAVFHDSQPVNGKPILVKGGRELALNTGQIKATHFDKRETEGPLYNWSSLRSEYLGEANERLAREQGYGPGWGWDSATLGYTWFPGNGLLYSPFGYGFYSPAYFGGIGGPFYGGGYYSRPYYGGGGYYGGGYSRGGVGRIPLRGPVHGVYQGNAGPHGGGRH